MKHFLHQVVAVEFKIYKVTYGSYAELHVTNDQGSIVRVNMPDLSDDVVAALREHPICREETDRHLVAPIVITASDAVAAKDLPGMLRLEDREGRGIITLTFAADAGDRG